MLRPKRRASQTYFFKYQLARNPSKAEEEDLKYAIMASLQQCNNSNSSKRAAAKKAKGISPTTTTTTTTTTNTITAPNHPITTSTPFEQVLGDADDEYLKNKHKPETEDFLTFICYRNIPMSAEPALHKSTTNNNTSNCNNNSTNNTNFNNNHNNINSNNSNNNNNNININGGCSSPIRQHHRAPIRQSPRLANSQSRKISENENSSNLFNSKSTAYDNSITYEEDMERASIALEDMAHEIHSSDGIKEEFAQESSSTSSSLVAATAAANASAAASVTTTANNKTLASPYKNNKHLVKGLMTREFAGAFADEDTIFESISNHKL